MMLVIHPTCTDDLVEMNSTAYCLDGITASGIEVQKGICAVNDKSMIGDIVVLYQKLPNGDVGKMIGVYVIADTGCKKNVVDVWMPDLTECQAFMDSVYADGCKGKVYVQIIEKEIEECTN